jgi:hypothetical protein
MRIPDALPLKLRLSALLLALVIFWMVAGPLTIAGAVFPGFIAYYLVLLGFVFINLSLLWAIRQRSSLRMVLPFLV